MKKNIKKRLMSLVKILFVGLIIFFIIQKVYLSWNEVSSYTFRFNWFSLITSLLLILVGFALFSKVWVDILSKMNIKLRFLDAYDIWNKSQLSKYVPGMVWIALSRVYMCKKKEIRARDTIISVILEIIFMVLSALMIAVYPLMKNIKAIGNGITYLLIITAGLIITHPKIFGFLVDIATKIFKQERYILKLRYMEMIVLLTKYIGVWIVIGSGFYFLFNSIYPLSISQLPYMISTFSLAWSVGFLILFAPGGLGVREGIITLLLSNIITMPLAIIIAFSARIWWIFGEALSFIIASLLNKTVNRKKRRFI